MRGGEVHYFCCTLCGGFFSSLDLGLGRGKTSGGFACFINSSNGDGLGGGVFMRQFLCFLGGENKICLHI